MARILFLSALIAVIAGAQETGARYLIITSDNFYSDIQPLATWKHKKGLSTKVVRLSETGSSSSQIRSYILGAYNTWPVRPEYLLLVGAPNYLPFPSVNGTYSDNYYTNMDADIYNEILSGRLTVHSSSECQTVVNKILAYERTPDLSLDSTWFIDGCLVIRVDNSQPSDSIYWSDINFAAGAMVGSGFREIDTLSSSWGNNANDILNSVNNGCAFVMYRGQGVNNWWSPFGVNPDQTANGDRLPIVLSFTCSTIGTGSTPATAERWFLTGTPASLRGGAGYFATTTVISGGAHLRSAVCKGFIKDVFNGTWPVFGRACEGGRKEVYSLYPSGGGEDEYYGFTTIGDPSMNLWTGIPTRIDVTHDSVLYVGMDTVTITVRHNGTPVESAYVCASMDTSVYETGYTLADGQIAFTVTPTRPGLMALTVTGHNLDPNEGYCTVSDTAAFLALASYHVNDSLGNSDSIPNNGETILVTAVIKNLGPSAAQSVWSILHLSDTLVFPIDSIAYVGTVPSYDSTAGRNPFVIAISPETPDLYRINCRLVMKDAAGDTWPALFYLTIRNNQGEIGPDPYGYFMYDDTDTLTGMAPVFNWFEIDPSAGGPGALVAEITDEDADTVTYPLPFTFPFYGQPYDSIGLCSNGFTELGAATYRFGTNTSVPMLSGPRRMVAPFWDDLAPNVAGDIVYFNDTLDHCWRLEFKDCAHYDNSGNQETFQMALLDPAYYPTPTGDGEVLLFYDLVADATSNTVGIEDETETRGLQYVFDNNYNKNAAPMEDGRAIRITTSPPVSGGPLPWLYCARIMVSDSAGGNNNGMLEPGETGAIVVTVTNRGDTVAYQTTGVLSCLDADGMIIDSIASFGDMAVGGSQSNETDPFLLVVSPTPADSMIGLMLRLQADNTGEPTWGYFTVHLYRADPVSEQTAVRSAPRFELTVRPNPFNTQVDIRYMIQDPGSTNKELSFKIYDISGRLVRDLSLPTAQSPRPTVVWDGTDQSGRQVSAGVYFIRAECGDQRRTAKIIRLQ